MEASIRTRARRAVRLAIVAVAGIAALVLAALIVADTPAVRRVALRQLARALESRAGIVLAASALDYTLFGGRIVLVDPSLAATTTPADPFFSATRVEISLPVSAIFGALSIDELRVDGGRVAIRRRADGTSNLPAATDDGPEEPQAVRIDDLRARALAVSYTDEGLGLSLDLPVLTLDVRPTSGRITATGAGRFRSGAVETAIDAFGGGVAFDGRAVTLDRFVVKTSEGEATVDGRLELFRREPAVNVRFVASADVERLARWAAVERGPQGRVAARGTIEGPLDAPRVAARIDSDRLAFRDMHASALRVEAAVDSDGLTIRRLDGQLAGGQVSGSGNVAFATGLTRAEASWSQLDVDALLQSFMPTARFRPGARATGSATLEGSGAEIERWTIDAHTRFEPRAAAQRLALGGMLDAAIAGGEWRLNGIATIADAPVEFAVLGSVGQPVTSSTLGGRVVIEEWPVARLSGLLSALGEGAALEESIERGLLSATAELAGTVGRPAITLNAEGRDLSVAGVMGIAATMTARGDPRQLGFRLQMQQGTENHAAAFGSVWPQDSRLAATLDARLDEPGALVPAAIGGRIAVAMTIDGPLEALVARGTATVEDAAYDRLRLGRLVLKIAARPQDVHIDAEAPELGARARTDVDLTTRWATAHAEIDRGDIARLVRDLDLPVALAGLVSMTADAEGPLDSWTAASAAMDVSHLDGRAGGLPVRLVAPGRVTLSGGAVDVAEWETALGGTRLSVRGRYRVDDDAPPVPLAEALRAQVVGDLEDVIGAIRATGLAELPAATAMGPVALLAVVTGAGASPEAAIDVEAGPADVQVGGLPAIESVRVRARVSDGWAEVESASGSWQRSEFALQSRLPLTMLREHIPRVLLATSTAVDGPATLSARVTSITPAVLAPFLDPASLETIGGTVDASAQLQAASLDPAAVSGFVQLDRLDLAVAGLPVAQREPTRIAIADGVADITSWNWIGQGATLTVQGQVRLADRTAAVLAGGRIDLRLLSPFLRESGLTLAGTMIPRIAIAGPLDDPRIDGTVELSDGEVRMRNPDVIVTALNGSAALSPERADIEALSGTINGGTLTGSGEVDYRQLETASARITTAVRGMGFEFPEGLRSEADAELTLALQRLPAPAGASSPLASGRLTGDVTVLRSAYREPIAVVTGLLAALRNQRLALQREPGDELASQIAVDVGLVTENDVVVDNNLARLELGGDLRIIGTLAAPALAGRATLREGGQLFLGRNRYVIDNGTIDFVNPDTIEPRLAIEARTRAGGLDIELTVTGTPEDLDVEPRAPNAPEPVSEVDLASILLTGRRLSEVTGNEAEIVGEQVLGYLSGDLLGAASRLVGVDTIRLGGVEQPTMRRDPSAIASEADPTSRITFGKNIGEALEVIYSQSLRRGDAQTWIVDYAPLRQLNLRLVSDDDNLRAYELRHDLSLGRGAEPASRPPASAQTPEMRVTSVTLTGDAGVLESRLRDVLDLDEGEVFDFAGWQRDRDRLEALLRAEGWLEARIAARRQPEAAGVALQYAIDVGPRTSIRVAGYRLPDTVLAGLRTAWSHSVVDEFLEDEATGIVRQALADEGYLEPGIEVSIGAGAADQARAAAARTDKTLTIVIDPRARTTERVLIVSEGRASAAGRTALATDMDRLIREGGLLPLAWSDPQSVERAIAAELRSRGYVQPAMVVAPPTRQGTRSIVEIRIEPGSRVSVTAVAVSGNTALSNAVLLDAAGIEAGAPFDGAVIDAARARLERAYRTAGFADVTVTASPSIDTPSATASLTFAVVEGPRHVLREIDVRGNRGIDAGVIIRAIDLGIGEPLGAFAWLEARARLFDTGLFRRVDVGVDPIAGAETPSVRPVRLTVAVQEWPALRLRYGLQVSEERPEGSVEGRDLTPGVSVDVTRRTLFGRAIAAGVAGDYQRRQRTARAFVNTPTLWGLPIQSVLSVQRAHENFADATLITDRTGISWEQQTRVVPRLQLSYSYSFERNHTFDTVASSDPLFPTFDITINVARLTGAAVFDTRDDPLDSTRGLMFSSSLEYAPEGLGSSIRFVRHLGQAYHFQPLRGVVFASAARIGLAAALGGQVLIASERFFAGGARTVRGVAEDALGPRDLFGPTGGRALVLFNHEVRFPVYRWVRGVGFFDVGNAFERPADIDFRGLARSLGIGVRISTPFGLLRTDYAHAWPADQVERPVRWTFGIGHTF